MGIFFPCSLRTKPPWQPRDNSKGEGHSRPRSEPSSPWHDLHAHPLQSCSIATTAPRFDVLACPVSHPAPHPEMHAQGTSPSGRKYRCQAGSASPAPWAFFPGQASKGESKEWERMACLPNSLQLLRRPFPPCLTSSKPHSSTHWRIHMGIFFKI